MSPTKTTDRGLTEVTALFNAKASTWNEKYDAGGALAFRAAAFAALVRERVLPNARVLDLGCGTGAIASVLSAQGFSVTACDIAEEMIAAGRRTYGSSTIEWCLLSSDWKQLPFESLSFDAVISSSVLEYVPDLSGFLVECQRVLDSRGVLLATVPNPRAFTRKLETLVRPAVAALHKMPGLRKMSRVHSYATYLKCSRNRMSLDEWRASGVQARFASVHQIETAIRNNSLAFLAFRKAAQR